jgi:heat shock protein HslJ
MRRLSVLIALAVLTLLAFPAVVAAADPTAPDPTPAPVVDPTAVPPTDPTAVPVVDPTPMPVVEPTPDPVVDPSSFPVESPAEPPVECTPDSTDCIGSGPIVIMPAPCPTGAEVCTMAGGSEGGVLPAGGMFFSITKITDGTTSYDVQGTLTMGPDGLSANVGCNSIGAPATWDAATNTLTITGPVVSTKMACMGDPGAAEALLVQLLGAGTVTWDGTTLAGAGITADAMVAMADGVNPIYLANDTGTVASGSATGAEAAPTAAAAKATSGGEGAASMVLLLTAGAMVAFLLVGGLIARRASRQG